MKNLKTFVNEWNIFYPIDRWWREKHEVAFNSQTHRGTSFIDMAFEYTEDRVFNRIRQELRKKKEVYIAGSGEIFKKDLPKREFTEQDLSSIDLSAFDKVKEEK